MTVTADQVGYARSVASNTMRLWPHDERDDGYADAMYGLLVAARNFQPGYGSRFTSYAYAGIRGAVLDGLERRIGRSDRPLPLHLYDVADPADPYAAIELADRRRTLAKAINELAPRSRWIVTLHFFEGMTMKAVGEVFDLTESRICQLVKRITRSATFDPVRA